MSNICKNGNAVTTEFFEPVGMNLFYTSYPGDWNSNYGYTPSTGINSTINSRYVNINGQTGTYYITLKLTYSGFDTSNTEGTFRLYFQGDSYRYSTNIWSWTNAMNTMVTALNNQKMPTDLVLSKTEGSFVYNTSFIVKDTDIKYLRLGMRSDYSNGKGKVVISDVFVVHEKYYTGMKISNNYILAEDFIEI